MALKIAFIGFRHGHIRGLYASAQQRSNVEIVAACEEDAETRDSLADSPVKITHSNYADMLRSTPCDVVACGDYYGIRGERLIAALEAGKHVIADKPICTRLSELDRIDVLAQEKGLRVGCQLDLPGFGVYIALRDLIRRGDIGEVHAITFLGQHPLNYGVRPGWYFEEGKHGGTINDIAIHGIDLIPWMTGRMITEVTAARAWNAKTRQHPFFQDGAVFMLKLDNNGALLGDVSYLAPDKLGYSMPTYWRFTISGSDGVAETSCTDDGTNVWRHGDDVVRVPAAPSEEDSAFDAFLNDVAGTVKSGALDTKRVLHSARVTLMVQAAADNGVFPVALPST